MVTRRFAVALSLGLTLAGFACSDSGGSDSNGPVALDGSSEGDVDPDDADGNDASLDTDGADTELTPDSTKTGNPETGVDAGDVEGDIDCTVDSDSDGLNDCDEAELCTDPHDGDTDGDHLSDFEELQNQTDPCKKDTDGDGLNDSDELEFGLDPTNPKTDGNTVDGNRWVVSACKSGPSSESEPVDFYRNKKGNWRLALPTDFGNYTALTLTNVGSLDAAAVYDDPSIELAGALLSKKAKSGQPSPTDPIKTRIPNKVGNVASIDQDLLTGEFDTHDDETAASVEYELSTSNGKSVRRLRDEILFQLAPFDKSDASGLPSSAGAQHTKFKVEISVIQRSTSSGSDRNLISIAVAPFDKFQNVGKIKFRMDDLTNTTNVSESEDSHRTRCEWHVPDDEDPKAEFYWVLDQSASMDAENNIVRSFSSSFEKRIRNTSLDYRLGVTNMDPENDGRLHVPPAWHRKSSTFSAEIRDRVTDCKDFGCSGGTEYGLEVAMQGLRYMLGNSPNPPTNAEKIRSGANIITIFMTDEAAQGDHSNAVNFFKGRSTAFAITAQQSSCDGTPAPEGNYKEVALATGGAFADLCTGDLTKTLDKIILKASGLASQFVLGETPVSSSLRVYMNGDWVPRNRENGFDYFPQKNSIAFFGTFRPEGPNQGTKGETDYISVAFERFRIKCKYEGNSSNCQPGGQSNEN